ncbi:hypothetical protein BURKHO8Y_40068 [Burkholderia sp. 8Y]|nr:hypothetical protein BURKHO8Y_40068 [Burkholderia sp. 8Y]
MPHAVRIQLVCEFFSRADRGLAAVREFGLFIIDEVRLHQAVLGLAASALPLRGGPNVRGTCSPGRAND